MKVVNVKKESFEVLTSMSLQNDSLSKEILHCILNSKPVIYQESRARGEITLGLGNKVCMGCTVWKELKTNNNVN